MQKSSSSAPASASVTSNNDAPKVFEEMPGPVENNAAPASEARISPAVVNSGALGSALHPASEGGKRVVTSPYAKKLAKDLGVD